MASLGAAYSFDEKTDQSIYSYLEGKPLLLLAYQRFQTLSVLGERLLTLVNLDVHNAVSKGEITIEATLLDDDLRPRLKVLVEEMLSEPSLLDHLLTLVPQLKSEVEGLLDSLQDDSRYKLLSKDLPSKSPALQPKTTTTLVPIQTLMPRVLIRKQLNLRRIIQEKHPQRYQELRQSPFKAGAHALTRHRAILEKMEEEIRRDSPEKIKEYKEYLADYRAGNLDSRLTEQERMEAAGRAYDHFARALNKFYGVNLWSAMIWLRDDHAPTFDFRKMPRWSIGGGALEAVSQMEELTGQMIQALAEPGGTGLGLAPNHDGAEVDPPRLPTDQGRSTQKVLYRVIREFLNSVGEWQGGGFRTPGGHIQWVELAEKGVDSWFLNSKECIPDGLKIGPIDGMKIGPLRLWYNHLLKLQEQTDTPVVFVDRVLRSPRSDLSACSATRISRHRLDEDEESSSGSSSDESIIHHDTNTSSAQASKTLVSADQQADACGASQQSSIQSFEHEGATPHGEVTSPLTTPPHSPRPQGGDLSTSPAPPDPAFPSSGQQSTVSDAPPGLQEFPKTTLGNRTPKPGPPRKIAIGSPSRRERVARKRKREANELRKCGDDGKAGTGKRARARAPAKEASRWTRLRKHSPWPWGVPDPLESIARESYVSKKYSDLPVNARESYKNTVKGVHGVDSLLKGIDESTFSIPELPEAPEAVILWAQGCNSGQYVQIDNPFLDKHGDSILTWLEQLEFESVANMTDEEILSRPWFRPNGQGLSHVLWALRVGLRAQALNKQEKLPEVFGRVLSGIDHLVERLKNAPSLLAKLQEPQTLNQPFVQGSSCNGSVANYAICLLVFYSYSTSFFAPGYGPRGPPSLVARRNMRHNWLQTSMLAQEVVDLRLSGQRGGDPIARCYTLHSLISLKVIAVAPIDLRVIFTRCDLCVITDPRIVTCCDRTDLEL
ncbi:hypothetical protein K435DRAFT_940689 [Dendrothele bispora CBS 962.96]|uniref:Uncharacterized protein n=1 Tax=Dendrothele bispora (strain CBS 962.96) TaxID=1314807 RepID=A0A4S8MTQ0_DENBC|nr:hypothetical protein K435DRAFT_940689 [Dendrothele bispora CBS 962.96]